MCINLIVVAIFAIDAWLRATSPRADVFPFVLSIAGVVLVCISGWLGGEMVHVYGVTVEPAASARLEDRDARRVA